MRFCSGARSAGRKGGGGVRGWPAPAAPPARGSRRAAPTALGGPGAAAASRPALWPGRCGGGADQGLPRRPAHGRGNCLAPREPRRGLGEGRGAGWRMRRGAARASADPLCRRAARGACGGRRGAGWRLPGQPAPLQVGAGGRSPQMPGRCWRGREGAPQTESAVHREVSVIPLHIPLQGVVIYRGCLERQSHDYILT